MGAAPVPVPDLRGGAGPAAAPEWELDALRLTPIGKPLLTRKPVWAVPPGEYGWVRCLEEFFDRARAAVPHLLRTEVARP